MPSNFSIQFPVYTPAMRNILSITNSSPVLITTTFDGIVPGNNGYQTGLIVRLIIPKNFGMTVLNQFEGPITVVSTSSFTMPIDTTFFDAFIVPPVQPGQNGTPAQVVPFGETNNQLVQAVKNVLPYP